MSARLRRKGWAQGSDPGAASESEHEASRLELLETKIWNIGQRLDLLETARKGSSEGDASSPATNSDPEVVARLPRATARAGLGEEEVAAEPELTSRKLGSKPDDGRLPTGEGLGRLAKDQSVEDEKKPPTSPRTIMIDTRLQQAASEVRRWLNKENPSHESTHEASTQLQALRIAFTNFAAELPVYFKTMDMKLQDRVDAEAANLRSSVFPQLEEIRKEFAENAQARENVRRVLLQFDSGALPEDEDPKNTLCVEKRETSLKERPSNVADVQKLSSDVEAVRTDLKEVLSMSRSMIAKIKALEHGHKEPYIHEAQPEADLGELRKNLGDDMMEAARNDFNQLRKQTLEQLGKDINDKIQSILVARGAAQNENDRCFDSSALRKLSQRSGLVPTNRGGRRILFMPKMLINPSKADVAAESKAAAGADALAPEAEVIAKCAGG